MAAAVVNLKAWSDVSALVIVDGIRVQVRRSPSSVRWICDEHGTATAPHCEHTEAAAATPADPDKRRGRGRQTNPSTTQPKER